MTIDSMPSKPIHFFDVPEIKRLDAKFHYNFFTPDETGDIELIFHATGVYNETELRVKKTSGANKCTVKQGHVVLNVDHGARVEIEVTLEDDYTGPVEVSAVRSAS